ncbi:MAG: hypothetical protein HYW90_02925 [Candidatus Sungbacteria bacterium]|nr:hypothetical protein [Candidatus Sungbacteria bacterium]
MERVPNARWWQVKHAWLYTRLRMEGLEGPQFVDNMNTYVDPDVLIGAGTVVEPNVWIKGNTVIGKNCRIGFGSVIIDSELENDVVICGARIEQCYICHHAEIGYTAQMKRTRFGARSKMVHRGYLGDATVGEGVNIGADVTTANYDGANKHKTVIGDNAFIGTGVNLVAPIEIPTGMMIASGSTVTTKDPKEPGRLLVARAPGRLSQSKRVVKDERGWLLKNIEEEDQLE